MDRKTSAKGVMSKYRLSFIKPVFENVLLSGPWKGNKCSDMWPWESDTKTGASTYTKCQASITLYPELEFLLYLTHDL